MVVLHDRAHALVHGSRKGDFVDHHARDDAEHEHPESAAIPTMRVYIMPGWICRCDATSITMVYAIHARVAAPSTSLFRSTRRKGRP